MILVDFGVNFPCFWQIFCYPDLFLDPFHETDPDPADINETDPNGSGSATLEIIEKRFLVIGRDMIEMMLSPDPEMRGHLGMPNRMQEYLHI